MNRLSRITLPKSVDDVIKMVCAFSQNASLEDGGTVYGLYRSDNFYVDCIDVSAKERSSDWHKKFLGAPFFPKVEDLGYDLKIGGGHHTHPKNYGAKPQTNDDLNTLKYYLPQNRFEIISDLTDTPRIRAWIWNETSNQPRELEVIVDTSIAGRGVIGVIKQYKNLDDGKIYPHPLKKILQV